MIIPVSAQQGINIELIWKALAEIPVSERDKAGEPIFLVARSFDINRPGSILRELHGAVLGGTLKRGMLRVGDEIEIKPGRVVKEANKYRYETIKTKIKGLYRAKPVQELVPGGSMSIETELDMALGKGDALAGNVVSIKGKLPELTQRLKIQYKLFGEASGVNENIKVEQIKASEALLLSINTSLTGGIVGHLRGNEIEINLKMPIIAFKGDNVGMARNIKSHWRLIGSGKVI